MRKVLWALLLGAATSVLIGLAGAYVPNSHAKGVVIDACALPGAVLSSIVYPEGPHTGSGAPSWALVVVVLNFFVYCGVWLALLVGIQRWRPRH